MAPHEAGEPQRLPPRPLRVVVRGDEHVGAQVGNVRERVADVDPRGQAGPGFLQHLAVPDRFSEEAGRGDELVAAHQHRQLNACGCRFHLAVEEAQEVARRPLPRGDHVGVGVGQQQVDDVDAVEQPRGEDGVQVHRRRDRLSGAEDLANSRGQPALRIVLADPGHGSVQEEEGAVGVGMVAHGSEDLPEQALEVVRGDRPPGCVAKGVDGRHQLDVVAGLEHGDAAGGGAVGAAQLVEDLPAAADLEILVARQQGVEAADLLVEAGDEDTFHGCLSRSRGAADRPSVRSGRCR